ncbi:hypothetical protein [Salinibacillus xinjiangensis]|uniref:Uncharacterized protein n=1 Tax=Salinibacillus xinjiangensis TaxID=1229268 RepID=A0A6G1X444_9BACI|nr:hypothetical protein [Salinibacillus xinjiangensis]MRG85717.1 hypothetical protein [Salinibacillus xinjiangensis]
MIYPLQLEDYEEALALIHTLVNIHRLNTLDRNSRWVSVFYADTRQDPFMKKLTRYVLLYPIYSNGQMYCKYKRPTISVIQLKK